MSVITRVAGVGHDEFDDVFTDFDRCRYVQREGNVAADMLAYGNTVEFDRANHIHSVEVQNRDCFDEVCVEIERAMIVKHVVGRNSRALGNAGKQTFR